YRDPGDSSLPAGLNPGDRGHGPRAFRSPGDISTTIGGPAKFLDTIGIDIETREIQAYLLDLTQGTAATVHGQGSGAPAISTTIGGRCQTRLMVEKKFVMTYNIRGKKKNIFFFFIEG
ncbi:MAG: hypothetical protein GY757_25130, partial [bacterium]|nr:hypothetical protein [bacterium]